MNNSKAFIGMRIVKTALAVLICLIGAKLVNYEKPFYACLSCVLMMKDTPKASVKSGFDRSIGTILGGIVAQFVLWLTLQYALSPDSFIYILMISGTLLIDLALAKALKLSEYASSMSCILILAILLNHSSALSTSMVYAVSRVLETLAGIVIAVCVNRFISPQGRELKGMS